MRRGAGANALQWVKSIDEADVKVEGEAATLQPPPIKAEPGRPGPGAGTRPVGPAAGPPRTIPTKPIHLKRVEGKWKTDLSQLPGVSDDPARAAQLFASMAKAYEETAAEVSDGKYRTAREAHAAVGRKVFSALGGGGGPAAGGPAPPPPVPPARRPSGRFALFCRLKSALPFRPGKPARPPRRPPKVARWATSDFHSRNSLRCCRTSSKRFRAAGTHSRRRTPPAGRPPAPRRTR